MIFPVIFVTIVLLIINNGNCADQKEDELPNEMVNCIHDMKEPYIVLKSFNTECQSRVLNELTQDDMNSPMRTFNHMYIQCLEQYEPEVPEWQKIREKCVKIAAPLNREQLKSADKIWLEVIKDI